MYKMSHVHRYIMYKRHMERKAKIEKRGEREMKGESLVRYQYPLPPFPPPPTPGQLDLYVPPKKQTPKTT